MMIHTVVKFLIFIISSVFLTLAFYIWKKRQISGAKSLTVLILCVLFYAVLYLLQMISQDLNTALLLHNLGVLGASLIAPAWFVFIVKYAHQSGRIGKRYYFLLGIIPFLTCLFAWTNQAHGYYGQNYDLVNRGGLSILTWDIGLWYWINFYYAYLLSFAGIVVLISYSYKRTRLFTLQTGLLFGGAIFPALMNISFVLGFSPISGVDLSPFSFLVTAVLWSMAILRFKLLNLVPTAMHRVFGSLADGIVILDIELRIVEINPAACAILKTSSPQVVGYHLPDDFANSLPENIFARTFTESEVFLSYDDKKIRIRVLPLTLGKNRLTGWSIQLQDVTVLTETQSQLKQSVDHLSLALSGSGLGIWNWDVANNVTMISEKISDVLGYRHEEFSPITDEVVWKELIHPKDRQRSEKLLEEHFIGKTSIYECELRIRHNDGHWVWMLYRGKVVEKDQNGEPLRISGICFNITQRKLVEAELKNSEQNFRNFFHTIDEFLFIADESGTILQSNQLVSSRLKYSQEELQGKELIDLFLADQNEELKLDFAKFKQQEAYINSIPLMSRDGQIIPVETRFVRGRWDGQSVYFGVSKDLSDLKASEEMFSIIFQKNPNPMAIMAFDSKFIDINESFEISSGYCADEVLGKTPAQVNLFYDQKQREGIEQSLSKREPVFNMEVDVLSKTGDIINGRFSAEFLRIQQENYVLIVIVDETEHKKLKNALQYQSTHDTLTGLYNRQYYEEEVERLQNSRLYPISILMLDMDGLKVINDTQGHLVGDQALRNIAKLLKKSFRAEDMIARIGGDEFVIVLSETDHAAAQDAVDRLLDVTAEINQSFDVSNKVNFSIGMAVGDKGCKIDELLKMADKAMYIEKERKRLGGKLG